MSKSETAPLKNPLDPKITLNFNTNHLSIITCPRLWTTDVISLYSYKQHQFLAILEASITKFT